MKVDSVYIDIRNIKATLSSATTRFEMISLFGAPDDVGGFSRKMKRGVILKYESTEFHFSGDQDNDRLSLIYREREIDEEHCPELSIKFGEMPAA